MPRLRVSVLLPYVLRLHDGNYPTGAAGESVQVAQFPFLEDPLTRTVVSADFEHPQTTDRDELFRFRARDAEQLIRRTNRLLRWYRAVSRQSEIRQRNAIIHTGQNATEDDARLAVEVALRVVEIMHSL